MRNGPGFFTRFARGTARAAGRPLAFTLVTLIVIVWAASGPFFNYSETWQLTINTLTTIVTFLMVFLIQHTQNRESEAMQLKLDELIVGLKGPRNEVLDSEDLTEEEQLALHKKYLELAEKARSELKQEVTELEGRRDRRRGRSRT
jgi:low affinity Fe/Cu permease